MFFWPRKLFHIVIITLLVLSSFIVARQAALAHICDGGSSECWELDKQVEALEKELQQHKSATAPLESQVLSLQKQLSSIQSQITSAQEKTKKLSDSIASREKDIGSRYVFFKERVREYYKFVQVDSVFWRFVRRMISSQSFDDFLLNLAYGEQTTNEDKEYIVGVTTDILQLDADKRQVEADTARLAALQQKLDTQKKFFDGEIAKSKKYQAELAGKIATLSAKQQSILSEKSGTFQTTVGDVPLADDPASRPDYNPGFSPAFAAFSFGAPHFKGMSQYGAFGRAKSGQDVDTILHAYYGGAEIKKDYDMGINITVQGYGSFNIEDYVKRIYEMPGSWGDEGGMEALKAQAVAARSYALAYTNNGSGSICATESCQVFKPSPKGGKWEEAVNATRGWVIVANGKPLSTWYASTSGGYQLSYSSNGYSTPGFWDTANGQAGWTGQAYEKIAGSPWFYKAWYKSRSGDACGRNHPWLNSEEMADILNAWVVLFSGGGDSSRVTPEGSCWGGSPYTKGELAGIGGFTSVSGVSVTYANNGLTANVTFQTNKGGVTIAGADFKKAFNLRAPARISLKSGLFNVEKK